MCFVYFLLREQKRFLPPAFGELGTHGHWGLEFSLALGGTAAFPKTHPGGKSEKYRDGSLFLLVRT